MPQSDANNISAAARAEQDERQIGTTHWSVVVAAGQLNSPQSAAALESLCRTYAGPLYAYVRRRVRDAHEAEDLTQEFIARVLEKNYFAQARADRGRFRSFLLTALQHFLANEWDKARAQKRGGNRKILSLDTAMSQSQGFMEPADATTPERAFDRQWATAVIDRVIARLQQEHSCSGKAGPFELLHEFLPGRPEKGAYDQVATTLGMSVGAVQVAVHRLRLRYRELLRAEIANTVADPAEVDAEIRELMAALSN